MAFGYMILHPFPSARLLRHCNYLPDHIMLIRILSFNNQTIEPPPFQVSSIFIVKNAFQGFLLESKGGFKPPKTAHWQQQYRQRWHLFKPQILGENSSNGETAVVKTVSPDGWTLSINVRSWECKKNNMEIGFAEFIQMQSLSAKIAHARLLKDLNGEHLFCLWDMWQEVKKKATLSNAFQFRPSLKHPEIKIAPEKWLFKDSVHFGKSNFQGKAVCFRERMDLHRFLQEHLNSVLHVPSPIWNTGFSWQFF